MTVSPAPAPRITSATAKGRMDALGQPFVDPERPARAARLAHELLLSQGL